MCLFFKIIHGLTPAYLKSVISFSDSLRNISKLVAPLETRTYKYKMSFFPTTIFSWNKILSAVDRGSVSLISFRLKLKSRIIKSKTNNFGLHFFDDMKYINQLRVGLSFLKKHMFYRNFKHITSPICSCGKIENSWHFLYECPLFFYMNEKNCVQKWASFFIISKDLLSYWFICTSNHIQYNVAKMKCIKCALMPHCKS